MGPRRLPHLTRDGAQLLSRSHYAPSVIAHPLRRLFAQPAAHTPLSLFTSAHVIAQRGCASQGTSSQGTQSTDTATAARKNRTASLFHDATEQGASVKADDSPFANFHRQRSSTSRRWEWEERPNAAANQSEETDTAAAGGDENGTAATADTTASATAERKKEGRPDDCSMPVTDAERRSTKSASSPPPSSSSSPASGESGGGVKRMSLTIRSPQQREKDRLHRGVTPSSTSRPAAAAAANDETPAQVLARRAHLDTTVAGSSSEGDGDASKTGAVRVRLPNNTLSTGASYAASNPKSFNTRLTIHPQRGMARFTEPVKRIVLLRNGISEANEDISAYVRTPDWRIPLTEAGRFQCVDAGKQLADLVGDEPVYFYYSPYIRSRQSLRYVLEGYDQRRMETLEGAESSRLQWWEREDDTGDAQNMSRAVNEATSGTHASEVSARARAMHSSADALAGENPTLASLSSSFTTTGTVGATSAYMSSEANRDAAVAAAKAAMQANPVERVTPSSSSSNATNENANNHVLPTGPSLVLRSGSLNHIIGVREDVRLRDGDIGRYSDLDALLYHLREREQYGRFFYRFPFGESGADVCDRVTSFLDAFQRERVDFPMDTNVVIITHGLTIRMFIKRWFHLTVDTFHRMQSPPSASLSTLTRLHHQSSFRLDEACVDLMTLPQSLNEHNGYKYRNKRLLGSMSTGAPYM